MTARTSDPPSPAVAALPPRTRIPLHVLLREIPGLTRISERFHAEGPVILARLGPRGITPAITAVTHPQGVAEILDDTNPDWDKGIPIDVEFGRMFGASSVSMPDAGWHARRRTVAPVMTRGHVEGFAQHMSAAATAVTDAWPAAGTVDIDEAMRGLALDVLGRSLFALDLAGSSADIASAFERSLRTVTRRSLSPFRLPDRLRLPGSMRDVEALRQIVDVAIERAIGRREVRTGELGHGGELVGLLLTAEDPETGERLTREEIRTELLAFLGAGSLTTPTPMSAGLWALARDPVIQERVRDEVRAIGSRPWGADHREVLPYTGQVVAEALRLYPTSPAMGRVAVRDTTVMGYRVEAGDIALLGLWAIYRDPAIYPDPLRFDPDRFTGEAVAARPRGSYLPFGSGHRSCIGEHFAVMEATIAIATIVRDFTLSTDLADLPVTVPLFLHVQGPVPLHVERR